MSTKYVWAVAGCVALAAGRADAAAYQNAVLALNPTHYYQLNETTLGSVADTGSMVINGTHDGIGVPASDPEVQLGDGVGQVGVAGPDNVYKYNPVTQVLTTIPVTGLGVGNRAIFNNDSLAVNLAAPFGPGGENQFAHTTMTLATWFKFPNADLSQPGVVETVFGPGNGGGDRLFTNNFNGQDLPGTSALDTSDVDDLGHFQIDIGGANLIVSLDNNFSDPLKSNYQIYHRGNDGTVAPSQDPVNGIAVKDGSWHHIVVSRNGDNIFNTILVIDGQLITTDRYRDSTDSWGISSPFIAQIGSRGPAPAPSGRTWGGWIDEMALWIGRQLTVQEAVGLWTAATGKPGDFDADGDVDGADILVWQRGLGTTYTATDLANWKTNFGSATPVAGAVPEPATAVLAAAGLMLAAGQRRRRSQL